MRGACDLLGPEDLFDRFGPPQPALTVASFATTTTARARNPPRPLTTPGPPVPAPRTGRTRPAADFEPGRALVEQGFDPLARRQLSPARAGGAPVGPASLLRAALSSRCPRSGSLDGSKANRSAGCAEWSGGDMLRRPSSMYFTEVGVGAGAEQPAIAVLRSASTSSGGISPPPVTNTSSRRRRPAAA